MIPGDKKKIAIAIISKLGKGLDDGDDEGLESSSSESEGDMGYRMAAKDVLSALEQKDEAALASALKAFVDLCSMGASEEDEADSY